MMNRYVVRGIVGKNARKRLPNRVSRFLLAAAAAAFLSSCGAAQEAASNIVLFDRDGWQNTFGPSESWTTAEITAANAAVRSGNPDGCPGDLQGKRALLDWCLVVSTLDGFPQSDRMPPWPRDSPKPAEIARIHGEASYYQGFVRRGEAPGFPAPAGIEPHQLAEMKAAFELVTFGGDQLRATAPAE